jgi:hypothetical protein
MRPAVAHRDAEPLRRADDHVGTPFARGRKQRSEWFSDMCSSLGKALREGIADREEYERILKESRRG